MKGDCRYHCSFLPKNCKGVELIFFSAQLYFLTSQADLKLAQLGHLANSTRSYFGYYIISFLVSFNISMAGLLRKAAPLDTHTHTHRARETHSHTWAAAVKMFKDISNGSAQKKKKPKPKK